jgi:hypothetical protein
MAASIQFFPFGPGLHQENDERLQDAGAPRAVENLIRTKNGRLQPRRDYETIALTGQSGVSNIRLYDLAGYGDRLLGFGRCTVSSAIDYTADSTADIFDLVEQPTHAWQRVPTAELGAGAQARFIARTGRKPSSITRIDVAAGGGRVCLVYEVILRPDTGTTRSVGVMVVDAATDSTVLFQGIASVQRPRVCFVNGSFFITAIQTSDNSINLYRYTPATDSALTALTDPVGAGASIDAYDLAASVAAVSGVNTFWIGVCRSDTTTALRGCDSAGAVTYTAAGPAVLGDFVTVFHHDTGGTQRLHVCIVRDTTLNIDLYTYLPPATTPAVSSTDLLTPFDGLSQPGMCLDSDPAPASIIISLTAIATAAQQILGRVVNFTTHGLGAAQQMLGREFTDTNSKSLRVKGRPFLAINTVEELGFSTHALIRMTDTVNRNVYRPVCVVDRFLGHELERAHLPSIAYDASTDLLYWAVSTEDEDRTASPKVVEMRVCGTDRRQTAHIGDVLYISGAILQAFDGRSAMEAGGFLTRPFISATTPSASAGSLEDPGIYQFIAVSESRDAKQRRIQSAPSNLAEQSINGQDAIDVTIQKSLTMRDSSDADNFTDDQLKTPPTTSQYRTLNTSAGNGTFHLDQNTQDPRGALRAREILTSIQSDTAISDESILYTQGARSALSGPLEFVCPDPCVSLAASADRILSGGLPEETRIQESRPLFPSEQVQWNDTLGFFRDVRARVLAVARLDERRIIFTATEIFEADGPGLDDNGLGEIGAPRRLPSDVGLFGGILGWRSIVEISAGILFQGLSNQIYLLPRGGVTPMPVGFSIEDKLAEYPDISAAVYMNEDQTVRFTCNNVAGTESIVLLLNVRFMEWFTEGPYAFGIRAAAKAAGRFYLLTSLNTVLRQRTELVPLAFVPRAQRSGVIHPFGPGMFGRVYAVWHYGTKRGNSRLRCIVRWEDSDEPENVEVHEFVDTVGLSDGQQFVFRFEFDRLKCESLTVDFEEESFQNEATRGLDWNYWALERDPSGVPNQVAPEQMS